MTGKIFSTNKSRLLQTTLKANAIFSLLSGLEFFIFKQNVSQFLGWSQNFFIAVIGAGLIGFALFVWQVAISPKVKPAQVKAIIAADIIWVLFSIILIAIPDSLSFAGKWGAAIVADIVALFAVLQLVGLRRTNN